jgi:AraC-type DNA-binding domain-containing proteins
MYKDANMPDESQLSSNYYYENVSHSERYPILVYYHARNGVDYCAKHWHRSLELCCYINTPITVWLNGVSKKYAADDLVIINYGDVHEMLPEPNEKPRGVSLIFPYEFLMDYSIKLEDVRFIESAGEFWDGELRSSLHKIVDLSFLEEEDPYYYLLVNSEIFRLLHILVTHYCVKDVNILESLHHLNRCKQILAYIDDNFNRNLSLDTLADELGLSAGYLARYFVKYLGTTFKQHLTSVRLQNSLTEVIRNDKTMLDIAMENGFPDYRSFIKAFRKWYKVTPYQYRILYRQKQADGVIDHSRPELAFAQHISHAEPLED